MFCDRSFPYLHPFIIDVAVSFLFEASLPNIRTQSLYRQSQSTRPVQAWLITRPGAAGIEATAHRERIGGTIAEVVAIATATATTTGAASVITATGHAPHRRGGTGANGRANAETETEAPRATATATATATCDRTTHVEAIGVGTETATAGIVTVNPTRSDRVETTGTGHGRGIVTTRTHARSVEMASSATAVSLALPTQPGAARLCPHGPKPTPIRHHSRSGWARATVTRIQAKMGPRTSTWPPEDAQAPLVMTATRPCTTTATKRTMEPMTAMSM